MKCQRCELALPRGASHFNEESCIEALKEALEKSRTCAACGSSVPTVIHPGCVPAELVSRGGKLASGVIERRLTEWLAEKIAGKPRDEDDPDRARRSRRGSGGEDRFVP